MAHRDEQFLRQLRATFRVEAAEHLQTIAAGLLELEKMPGRAADGRIVETVFRAVHSLKGAARAVDFPGIEALCQSLEEVFASWKRRQIVPSTGTLDILHGALDAIASLLAAAEGSPAPGAAPDVSQLRQSLRRLVASPAPPKKRVPKTERDRAAPAAAPASTPAPMPSGARPAPPRPPVEKATAETVRISVTKLEARLLEAEEMLVAKLAADQRAADLRALAGRFEAWRQAWAAIEPGARRLRSSRDAAASSQVVPQLLDFFEWSMDCFRAMENDAVKLGRAVEHDRQIIGRLVDDLLENSKQLLLLPLAALAAPLPKLVRDLCRDEGKEVDFIVQGEDIEIDKRILEEIKDPLIHLLRNG
ncbi:MAG: Hpt domain-containing protein, partial [Nevskiaceae bacterium]